MKILIVSDTHGRHGNLDEVLDLEGPIDMLLHLGDVENDDDYIEAIAEYPVHIIAGNNDYFSYLPKEKEIQVGKYKVWMVHGHAHYVSMETSRLKQAAIARGVDIVMYGHTHRPHLDVDTKPMLINPGSLSYPRQEGRKPSYVVMEIDASGNATFSLKCLE